MLDEVARFQMCEKVVVDFPDAWRKNVIETKRAVRTWESRRDRGSWDPDKLEIPEWLRAGAALRELADRGAGSGLEEDDLLAALQSLIEDPVVNLILETCVKHQVSPDEILGEAQEFASGY